VRDASLLLFQSSGPPLHAFRHSTNSGVPTVVGSQRVSFRGFNERQFVEITNGCTNPVRVLPSIRTEKS
jgi:hypothetical protein